VLLFFSIAMASTVLVPIGSYKMGSNMLPDEQPVHLVTIDHQLIVFSTEINQGLYLEITKTNPSRFAFCGQYCPVEMVSWVEALVFANALSKRDQLPACYEVSEQKVTWKDGVHCPGWRLPTEEEWGWLARGNQSHLYSGSDNPSEVSWYWDNGSVQTHRGGKKKANHFGLYDMSGNVWEWTWADYLPYGSSLSVELNLSDPKVLRGGAWSVSPEETRVTIRHSALPTHKMGNIGFRLVRTVK
jgi:formylglycine-generating enzyme